MNRPEPRHYEETLLVRGVNWLGDAIMTTPALFRLREVRPQAHITLLTHEKLADLWNGHPAVDQVMTSSGSESVFAVAKRIKAQGFGVGVALPNSHRSAIEMWLGGVPRRIGYSAPLRRLLLTDPLARPPGFARMRKRSPREIRRLIADDAAGSAGGPSSGLRPDAHHIRHYLQIAAVLGANPNPVQPRVHLETAEAGQIADKLLSRFGERANNQGSSQAPWFAMNPGAEYGPAKRWPRERFIEAAKELSRRTNCRWLIVGGPKEQPLGEAIAAALGKCGVDMAGKTSLRELMALLGTCRVLLSNDSGPAHLAAALGTPVVALFGSTSPELTAPGLPGDSRHRVLASGVACSPCFRRECPVDFRCMNQVDVGDVVGAVMDLYSRIE
jgi:heptosyltransferase-2